MRLYILLTNIDTKSLPQHSQKTKTLRRDPNNRTRWNRNCIVGTTRQVHMFSDNNHPNPNRMPRYCMCLYYTSRRPNILEWKLYIHLALLVWVVLGSRLDLNNDKQSSHREYHGPMLPLHKSRDNSLQSPMRNPVCCTHHYYHTSRRREMMEIQLGSFRGQVAWCSVMDLNI